MDPQRFKDTYTRLEVLDDRLTFKIRSRSSKSRYSPSLEQVDDRLRDLSEYTIELKGILQDLMVAIASKPTEGSES